MTIKTRGFIEVKSNVVFVVLPFKKDKEAEYDLRKFEVTNPSDISPSLHKTKVFVEMKITSFGEVKIISIQNFDRKKRGTISFNQNDTQFYPVKFSKQGSSETKINGAGYLDIDKDGNLQVIVI